MCQLLDQVFHVWSQILCTLLRLKSNICNVFDEEWLVPISTSGPKAYTIASKAPIAYALSGLAINHGKECYLSRLLY